MRNWLKTLLPASFRGVPFHVETDDVHGGRRLVIHEYAGSESALIEDMGRLTSNFSVTAYVIGDLADIRSTALLRACSQPGPGFLMLPIGGGMSAHLEEFTRTRERDRLGYISFDMRFVPASETAGSVLSLGDISAVFSGGIATAALGLAGLFR